VSSLKIITKNTVVRTFSKKYCVKIVVFRCLYRFNWM